MADNENVELMRRARERFKRCESWESTARSRFLDDVRFANADPDNGYQWPMDLWTQRNNDQRPALTVNKVRQHNLNIINDAKENKPGIKFRAAGGGATAEAARVWDGIARHIEYQSNAQAHYDAAVTWQVEGGIGYLRVMTDYVSCDSFDQEIYVTSIPDSLSVYIDPDAQAPAKEDMRFAFVFDDIPLEEAERKYPQYKSFFGQGVLVPDRGWIDENHVRIAEYFEVVDVEDELLAWVGPDGQLQTMHRSDLEKVDPKNKALKADTTRRRKTTRRQINYYFIVGDHVIEEETSVWPGETIPIIPVIGEEVIIDGQMDRKGHTRAMKDAQRMYNYWASSAVEYGALQSKTPWLTAVEAIEGSETYWATANTTNHAYLPFRAIGDNGEKLPPPVRTEPPVPSPVAIQGMQSANLDMQMVSGQYENQMGQQGNERTGRAIQERQRQGDKATYHFIDNLAIAIRQIGKIIMDLVPKIYDTQRVIMILAEDGESLEVKLDPTMQQAHMAVLGHNNEVVQRVLNPSVGKYEVLADVGPGYATKREEAFNALTLILTQSPQLVGIIGDLLMRAGDFPMSEEAATRLRRMVPKEALGEGPSPAEQQLQQLVQQLQQALQGSLDELTKEKGKAQARLEKREVEIYDAITRRLQVLGTQHLTALDMQRMLEEAMRESADVPISDTYEGHKELGQTPNAEGEMVGHTPRPEGQEGQMSLPLGDHEMPPGAWRGPDGHAYGPHPETGEVSRIMRQ